MLLLRPRTALLLCALTAVLLGCGSTTTEALGPCTSPVTVSIGAGPTPQISWSPACGVAQLTVFTPPSLGAPQTFWWQIKSPAMDIRPPVQLGTAPAGAEVVLTTQPMDTGQRPITVIVSDLQGNGLGGATRNP